MAWPPVIPPATRTNTTVELDAHPADHNAISTALTDLTARANTIRAKAQGVTTDAAGKAAITFTPAFAAGVTPIVMASTQYDNVIVAANPISNTGCTFAFRRADGSYLASFAVTVSYIATAPA